MCDIYYHKCEVVDCTKRIDMHITDFSHPRNEFKVYCKDHISLAPKGATIFTITKVDNIDVNMEWLYKNKNVDEIEVGWSCAIYGPDVGDKLGVCPNLASDMSEQIIE